MARVPDAPPPSAVWSVRPLVPYVAAPYRGRRAPGRESDPDATVKATVATPPAAPLPPPSAGPVPCRTRPAPPPAPLPDCRHREQASDKNQESPPCHSAIPIAGRGASRQTCRSRCVDAAPATGRSAWSGSKRLIRSGHESAIARSPAPPPEDQRRDGMETAGLHRPATFANTVDRRHPAESAAARFLGRW